MVKRALSFLMVGMTVMGLALSGAQAEGRPPGGGMPEGAEGPPGKRPKDGLRPPPGMRNHLPFKPFLMAGSPQFSQMLKMSLLPPDKVEAELQQWPKFQQMDEATREDFRKGIERFRHRVRQDALEDARAHNFTVPPGQEEAYLKSYWEKRIQIETRVRQQAEERLEQEMRAVFQDFGQRFPAAASP